MNYGEVRALRHLPDLSLLVASTTKMPGPIDPEPGNCANWATLTCSVAA